MSNDHHQRLWIDLFVNRPLTPEEMARVARFRPEYSKHTGFLRKGWYDVQDEHRKHEILEALHSVVDGRNGVCDAID